MIVIEEEGKIPESERPAQVVLSTKRPVVGKPREEQPEFSKSPSVQSINP